MDDLNFTSDEEEIIDFLATLSIIRSNATTAQFAEFVDRGSPLEKVLTTKFILLQDKAKEALSD